ncbi:MAG: plasmid pRiA4b ORF-3 family protein [Dysgonamonadaceae bacterium]|nr:plasmid pRiA4b ORF-3 family protein [Dysgonamonadaceae bacterium]
MVYRFVILSDEADNFRREILIDSDATFFDLYEAVLDSVGFTKDQMASFFICDDEWNKEKEITLIEMDTSSEEDNYVMDTTRLNELLEDERQKLLFIFEYLTDRAFFMELREIITGKSLEKAECSKSTGNPPPQITDFEEFEAKAAVPLTHAEEEDFFEEDFNLDEYEEEDFGNLSEGNPFDNY